MPAGQYQLTANSLATTFFQTNGDLVACGSDFQAGTQLEVYDLSLPRGAKWTRIRIQAASTITITLRSQGGSSFSWASSGSDSITPSSTGGSWSESGNLDLLILGGTCITSITVDYSDYNLIGYPVPYRPGNGDLTLGFDLPFQGTVTLKIYDNQGALVRTLANGAALSARENIKDGLTWDGRNCDGVIVATGLYTAVVEVAFLDSGAAGSNGYTKTFRFLVVR